jgi:hypothetical protein
VRANLSYLLRNKRVDKTGDRLTGALGDARMNTVGVTAALAMIKGDR